MRNWLLPEYVEDILPLEALQIELMRRQIMDLFLVHGYQQVIPPLLEYVESLLCGSGSDMDLKMFKVIDQLSGRMLGLRADMTPQAARIDAHLLNSDGITRLCYVNSVLHTVPSAITQTREPLQIGAELYGHFGLESDLEIQRLMLKCLFVAGIREVHLDLGHVAVFRGIIRNAGISRELEAELFSTLQAKDVSTLTELCKKLPIETREALMLLPDLYGDKKILNDADSRLPDYPEIKEALNELNTIAEELESTVNQITFDLADLRGYHYHTGIVFAAYSDDYSNAVALGGRYDEIGKSFGRARPATGFSMDLRELTRLVNPTAYPQGIRAPFHIRNKELEAKIEELRGAGHIVIMELPQQNNESLDCDRQLILHNGQWVVEEI
ncbi:MAG: ATP phosphoribosyltransferase regulatory subunit [Nitrosomonas sp. PRO4]|nr:ATP phosphoribosyltransferase regulatory subunit [Nitrosomonas sp. PRO4]